MAERGDKLFVAQVFLLLVACLCIIAVSSDVPYVEKYFDQTLDHFRYDGSIYGQSTYRQRYLIQDKWWEPGHGPIFFYTGNEGDIVGFWQNTGFMFDIATQFKALIVFAEHRFYGKSLPFGETKSFQQPYVGLLSVDQTLADFAVLIDWLKTSLNATQCPVIAFGGSYGGMLSAYMRFRYPNMVQGAVAASAPIFLAAGQAPRTAFFQDVTKDFRDAGCEDEVRAAFAQMSDAIKQPGGFKSVSQAFNLCKPLASLADYDHLVGWIRGAFSVLTMMDYPYPTQFLMTLPAFPVQVACQNIRNASDVVQGLAAAAGMAYGPAKCRDIWTEYVACSDPSGCGTGPEGLAWSYQACTDFLMPGGTNNVTDMFPVLTFTLDDRDAYCQTTWSVKPRRRWTNVNLWGKDIQSATNIVFTNGVLDPWRRGGVLTDISDSVVAIEMQAAAHHLDLRGANPKDPASVVQARQTEVVHIQQWIAQFYLNLV